MELENELFEDAHPTAIKSRRLVGGQAQLILANGNSISARRYIPLGAKNIVRQNADCVEVLAERDNCWVTVSPSWEKLASINLGTIPLKLRFKEIENEEELSLFESLRGFHYRGGGGAGRSVPIICCVEAPDLPRVIGFVELTSSMIANSARASFFSLPYREQSGLHWKTWDRVASRNYSNLICRIARFVIHPELRGLGLATHFLDAARSFAAERWHYGGFKARFLEITADMLRFYPFLDPNFVCMGETEGNEHRVSKDMKYLVKKALGPEGAKAMPQGGGGVMTMQRAYATKLLAHMAEADCSLDEAVSALQFDPGKLDQGAWEALHKLNRKPKPCYIAGLTSDAKEYLERCASRSMKRVVNVANRKKANASRRQQTWRFVDLSAVARSPISQSTKGRILQDTFGFVGSDLEAAVFGPQDVEIAAGETLLVCGASGSGKSVFLDAIESTFTEAVDAGSESGPTLAGEVSAPARVSRFRDLDAALTSLDYVEQSDLATFLSVAARCGLAEPQLLVRPISTLSSGQAYRLQLALAILEEPDILLIDNFCEPLDRFSARAVCKGLESLTKEFAIATIAATASYDRLEEIFSPDATLMLRRGDRATYRRAQDGIQEAPKDDAL